MNICGGYFQFSFAKRSVALSSSCAQRAKPSGLESTRFILPVIWPANLDRNGNDFRNSGRALESLCPDLVGCEQNYGQGCNGQ